MARTPGPDASVATGDALASQAQASDSTATEATTETPSPDASVATVAALAAQAQASDSTATEAATATPSPDASVATVAALAAQAQASDSTATEATTATPSPDASVATVAALAAQAQASSSPAPATVSSTTGSGSGVLEVSASSGGRGLTTASGAPLIVLNSTPAPGPKVGSYTGPAAYNPYFCTGGCPYQAGNVVGYDNWFQTIKIGTLDGSACAYEIDPELSASEEGGQEALRIVQQFAPGATLQADQFPCQLPGQPSSYDVKLPDGTLLSGGLVLTTYYNGGYGVTAESDKMMEQAVGLIAP